MTVRNQTEVKRTSSIRPRDIYTISQEKMRESLAFTSVRPDKSSIDSDDTDMDLTDFGGLDPRKSDVGSV